jgi:hypothetical protein
VGVKEIVGKQASTHSTMEMGMTIMYQGQNFSYTRELYHQESGQNLLVTGYT